MTEPHCPTCVCGRRAPVQGVGGDRRSKKPGEPGYAAGTVEWAEHLIAWAAYSMQYGRQQSAERMAERGGFGYDELRRYLGREPATWQPIRS